MNYKLWIENRAKAEIKKLPGNMRQRIRRTVSKLADAPRPHYSKQMNTPDEFDLELRRVRIDPWRVIYVVDEDYLEVGILAVRERPPYDYNDLPKLLEGLVTSR